MSSKTQKIIAAFEANGITVHAFKDKVFNTSKGDYYLYRTKYRFREAKETNIPVKLYKRIRKVCSSVVLHYMDAIYLLDLKDVTRSSRLVGGIKVYPISETFLTPLGPSSGVAADGQNFVHLHVHSDYCLSGNTKVYNCEQSPTRRDYTCMRGCRTIEQLYFNFAGLHPKGRNYNVDYRVKVFDGKRFVPSHIIDVRYSGEKQLFKLTTDTGKTVEASAEHKFLTRDGWKRVKQLVPNVDAMGCNGQLATVRTPVINSNADARMLLANRDWLEKKIYTDGMRHQEIADILDVPRSSVSWRVKKFGLDQTRENIGKRVAETFLKKREEKLTNTPIRRDITPNRSRQNARFYLKENCELCGGLNNIVHHIDEDPYNNSKENLLTVCKSCHELEHSPCPLTVKYETLVSVEKTKIEDTYDLEVEHETHNFVADGFITHNSLLDGTSSCRALVDRAAQLGANSLAITDHGNLSGHMDFYLRSKKAGIKPVFGVEGYFVKDATAHDADHRSSNHIVLLAKNDIGYANLLKLQRVAWSTENFYYRPRFDWRMLKAHSEGLVCLTACMKGLLSDSWLDKKPKRAGMYARKLRKIFDEDLYIELQLLKIVNDKGLDMQNIANVGNLHLAEKYDIPTVITNDVHYTHQGMHKVQDMVVKIHHETEMYGIKCTDIWMKTYDEMKAAHRDNCDYIPTKIFNNSMATTNEVAAKCNYEIPTGAANFPKFKYKVHPTYKKWDKDLNKSCFFRRLIRVAAKRKGLWEKSEYKKRIKYECGALIKTKSVDYVLIIDDLLRHMRKLGCLYHMRGSANGSLVCFLLDFGVVDPVRYNIMFERFISPGRILQGLQDIDIDLDFEAEYRDVAIAYLKQKYGEDHICSVGSFNRLQLKAAIKGLARVEAVRIKNKIKETEDEEEISLLEAELEPFAFKAMNTVTKAIHSDTIEAACEASEEVRTWYEDNKEWFELYVRPVIGNAYTASIHPAGVIITPTSYDNWLPVRTQKSKTGDRVFTTQWENSHTYEEFLNERGIMILDVLGVKTLSIIQSTLRDVAQRHGTTYSLDSIPRDDPDVYESLSKGENLGYFQLGKAAVKGLLRDLKPDCMDDLVFLSAADRPGALAAKAHVRYIKRKHGKEPVRYLHHSLETVLADTYGVIVYSEHIMKTAIEFADMHIVEAEELRKIIKAKDIAKFNAYRTKFMDGAINRWGEDVRDTADTVWEKFRASATYLFPLGHSTAYAIYGNATQWLKIHYPLEFFKNYLDYADDKEYPTIMKVAGGEYGVEFLNPSVNFSKGRFLIRKNKIQWSLASIKGIGIKAAVEIEKEQPFSSLEDFFTRVNKRVINVRVVKALIIAGALRKFGKVPNLMREYFALKKQSLPEEFENMTKAEWELERTKIITYNLQSLAGIFKDKVKRVDTFKQFDAAPIGRRVVVIGAVAKKYEAKTKKGQPFWILTLEDMGEQFTVVMWSDFLNTLVNGARTRVKKGSVIVASGQKSRSPKGEQQVTLGRERGAYMKLLRM